MLCDGSHTYRIGFGGILAMYSMHEDDVKCMMIIFRRCTVNIDCTCGVMHVMKENQIIHVISDHNIKV